MSTRAMALAMAGVLAACGGGGDDDDDDDDVVDVDAAPLPVDAAPPPDVSPAACDDFGPAAPGTNAGFQPPTTTLQAYTEVGGVWTLQGPANFSCLCGGGSDSSTATAVTVSGETRDFQTGDLNDNVAIDVFADGDSPPGTPIASTVSDANGDYSVVVPAGTGRIGFYQTDPEGTRFLDSARFHHLLDPVAAAQTVELRQISHLTANALPAFIGVMRTEGTGLINGEVVDCDGNQVAGAIATISDTSRTAAHLPASTTYYFSAGSTSLPVRHSQQADTNFDGLFIVIEMPPTATAYAQAWGYVPGQTPGVDPITLLSEVEVTVAADTWGELVLPPRRR